MTNREVPPLMQAWVGSHLPEQDIFPEPGTDEGFMGAAERWVARPVERHAAHWYGALLTRRGCEVIGITGSAGKTTTKELIAAVLEEQFPTVRSPENYDPVYNIPRTLLRTPLGTSKLVLEMGIEYPGEMDYYTWLVRPNIGVLTNVSWAHAEHLGGIEGVAAEKGKLIEGLPADGYAILNVDDARVRAIAKKTQARVVFFGSGEDADVRSSDVHITDDLKTTFTVGVDGEQANVQLQLLGQHFVPSALAAIAVGRAYGMDLPSIVRGLERVMPQPHRMAVTRKPDGTIIIDDSYNANPLATTEAIRLLAEVSRKRRAILVMGDMLELGAHTTEGHEDIGRIAAEQGIDYIFCLGDATRHTLSQAKKSGIPAEHLIHAEDHEALLEKLRTIARPDDVILIKGSRAMKMEKIVAGL